MVMYLLIVNPIFEETKRRLPVNIRQFFYTLYLVCFFIITIHYPLHTIQQMKFLFPAVLENEAEQILEDDF